jgi:L-histidine N-alpha-methyltransferase
MFRHADVLDFESRALDSGFLRDVLNGLSRRPRVVPARWFYDRRGSELFEAVTGLDEYYPTRTERQILSSAAAEISSLTGFGRAVIEFGAGSCTKTPIVLSATRPSAYVPVDISGDYLRASVATLTSKFPGLAIFPVEADFTSTLELPNAIGADRLGFFPGSTIGNLTAPAAADLLRRMATSLGVGSMLLIGMDRIKETSILLPAYDDRQGVTAAFNLNLLSRINRELVGTIPVGHFRHQVRWNDATACIEMHLEATRDMSFRIAGRQFSMDEGETIHTENSFKYGSRDASVLLRTGGWTPIAEWSDPDELFSVFLAEAKEANPTP